MKLFANKKLDHLMREMGRGYELQEARNLEEAISVYRAVLAETKRLGFDSGYVLWNLAAATDMSGDLEMAFDYITQAVATDPLARPFRNSFDIIARRIREALASQERAADDPSTPRLYELLTRTGEADVASHVAMARWCSATGDHARALALADAVARLNPMERDAWLCKAEVARAAGQHEVAAMATAEAAAIEGEPVPFAVPGVAQG